MNEKKEKKFSFADNLLNQDISNCEKLNNAFISHTIKQQQCTLLCTLTINRFPFKQGLEHSNTLPNVSK